MAFSDILKMTTVTPFLLLHFLIEGLKMYSLGKFESNYMYVVCQLLPSHLKTTPSLTSHHTTVVRKVSGRKLRRTELNYG